jgi:hypothetical protein
MLMRTSRRFLVALVCVAWTSLQGLAMAAEIEPAHPIETSPDPPAWAQRTSSCVVELADAENPSGVVGYIGYNVTLLLIVDRRHVSCRRAKRYARSEWVHGPAGQPLGWRYVKAWRSTAGSAYVGDFKGRRGKRAVEYFAVH